MRPNPYDPLSSSSEYGLGAGSVPEAALPTLRKTCRVLQIIIFALAMGVGTFAAYVIAMGQHPIRWTPPEDPLEIIMLAFGVAAALASFVVSLVLPVWRTPLERMGAEHSAIAPTGDPQADLAIELSPSLQTRNIVSAALLEGGAFANLAAVLISGSGWSLVLAGVLFVLLVLKFPTFGRYLETIAAALKKHGERTSRN